MDELALGVTPQEKLVEVHEARDRDKGRRHGELGQADPADRLHVLATRREIRRVELVGHTQQGLGVFDRLHEGLGIPCGLDSGLRLIGGGEVALGRVDDVANDLPLVPLLHRKALDMLRGRQQEAPVEELPYRSADTHHAVAVLGAGLGDLGPERVAQGRRVRALLRPREGAEADGRADGHAVDGLALRAPE